MPFFSIILPTYNRAHLLPKAIESVLSQTFVDWELIIVDDGSTDNTKELVASYQDKRIQYIFQTNQERSTARNNGINNASGEYICFLDSDDYFLSEKLSHFKNAIDLKAKENIIFYDGLIFEKDGHPSEVMIPVINGIETTHEFLIQNPIGPLQVCGRIELFLKHNFNPALRIGEDVELCLRMAHEVEFVAVQSYETVVLEHEDRSVNLKKYNAAKEQLQQLELIFKLYNAKQISQKIRKKILSNCYFSIAKHHMFQGDKSSAKKWILKAIITKAFHPQTKHRIFCLISLFKGHIPQEYLAC